MAPGGSCSDTEATNADATSSADATTQRPLASGCDDHWTWNRRELCPDVKLYGAGQRIAHFHPNWSSGTAGVRGTRQLNNGRYYWELRLSHRIFGTSMMIGIGTKDARLHDGAFCNLLGEDKNGWGLSHRGLTWHEGRCQQFTKPFKQNESTTIGILYDGIAGTLTYYKDGVSLGVAFRGLHEVEDPLFPIICSTAAKTVMSLESMRRDFVNLQDRCRAVILKRIGKKRDVDALWVPPRIKYYLSEAYVEPIRREQQNQILDQLSPPLQPARKLSASCLRTLDSASTSISMNVQDCKQYY